MKAVQELYPVRASLPLQVARQSHALSFPQKAVLFFLLFSFIFSPRLNFGAVIHAGFFSVFLLAIVVGVKQRRFVLPRPLFHLSVFFFFLAFYHLVMASFFGNNPTYFVSICITSPISVMFGWMVASFLAERGVQNCALLDQLVLLCALAVFVNSTIIIFEFLYPGIRSAVESLLVTNEVLNYAVHPFRFRGLAAAGGAGLSLVNALAVLLFIYLVANKKIASGTALFGSLVITLSNIFTGRTGLIFGLLFLFILGMMILIRNVNSGLHGFIRTMVLGLFFSVVLWFVFNFDLDTDASYSAFEWVEGLKSGKLETSSTDELATMLYMPDNPLHLLFGIGFFEGDNSVLLRSDSGYLKSVLSLGLPLAILLYSVILFLFFRLCKISTKYRWLVVSILAMMLIAEVKEPFLYQNFAARVIFLLSGAALFILSRRRAC